MAEVVEIQLPGVGIRYEFTTSEGERIGVVAHRGGWREIVVYDSQDPDRAAPVLHLSAGDTRTLVELLGASHVTEAVAAVQQQVEGLAIDWVAVDAGSRFVGSTIGDGEFRTKTGASIVAVVRGASTVPAPGPDFQFEAGDVVVAVGTPDGLSQVRALLRK